MNNKQAAEILRHAANRRLAVHVNGVPHEMEPDEIDTALRLAIVALERDRWIPCEERFPERNTSVLVHGIGNADGFWGEQVTAIADRFLFKFFPSDKGEEKWSSPWQYFHTDYKITHWMPLPEPPKEET